MSRRHSIECLSWTTEDPDEAIRRCDCDEGDAPAVDDPERRTAGSAFPACRKCCRPMADGDRYEEDPSVCVPCAADQIDEENAR